MNFNFSTLFAGFVFGVIGMYLINRARRLGHLPSLIIGVTLIAYPYFVDNAYVMWGIGGALLAVAYWMRD